MAHVAVAVPLAVAVAVGAVEGAAHLAVQRAVAAREARLEDARVGCGRYPGDRSVAGREDTVQI